MILWLDNQLSPRLAAWLQATFAVTCVPVRDRQLHRATDRAIFLAAREAGAVVMTKDADFLDLLEHYGPPPQIVWVTCGNTSTAHLTQVIAARWPTVSSLLARGEALVEVSDLPRR